MLMPSPLSLYLWGLFVCLQKLPEVVYRVVGGG